MIAERPDVVVLDPTTGWRGVAHAINKPIVTITSSFFYTVASPLVQAGLPSGQDLNSPQLQRVERDLSSLQRQLSRDHGIAPVDPDRLFTEPADVNLAASFRELQPDGTRFRRPRYLYLGPSLANRHESSLPELDRLPRPLVYAAFGSAERAGPTFLRMLVDAFGGGSWGIVASGEPPRRSPTWCVVRPTLPQLRILERADVFVTHAGINSVLEAIACCVPMILLPRTPEQSFVAEQVARLGAGVLRSRESITAESLRSDAVGLVESAEIRSRLEIAHALARSADGAEAAAGAIMALATASR
ncbi:MAG: nucleotide disphospho-sugar-binding domain-containing protein [Gaiellaceae bacterium]